MKQMLPTLILAATVVGLIGLLSVRERKISQADDEIKSLEAQLGAKNREITNAVTARDNIATELDAYLRTARSSPETVQNPTRRNPTDETSKIEILKDIVNRLPEQGIPELQLAKDADWHAAVDGDLETTEDYRRALARLRGAAERRFAAIAQPALKAYLSDNKGIFPSQTAQLQPYFADAGSAAILQRYKIVQAEEVKNVRVGGDWAITQTSRVDSEFDSYMVIGPNGHGSFTKPKRGGGP